jgi:trehalose 2-sulfotransferase
MLLSEARPNAMNQNPKTTYLICSTPRSGTHLLAETLIATGVAGRPEEYLICDQHGRLQNQVGPMAETYGRRSLEEFPELVITLGSSPNGTFGLIVMWPYLQDIVANFQTLPRYSGLDACELFERIFSNPKYIWLTRRDKIRQAISWVKAKQTGVWIRRKDAPDERPLQPKFDFFCINHHYRQAVAADAAWESYFQTHNIESLEVVYEDLVEDRERVAKQVLNHLNIPYPQNITYDDGRLRKQADRVNESWTTRYQEMRKKPISMLALFTMRALWKAGITSPERSLRGRQRQTRQDEAT